MRSMEFSGRTVDEAIFVGLNEMGVTIDEVEIETLQDETKGLFGFGARLARQDCRHPIRFAMLLRYVAHGYGLG